MSSVGTNLLELAQVPEEQLAALEEPPALYEEVSTSMVTTATPESVLASWGRIAGRMGPGGLPAEACGESHSSWSIALRDNHADSDHKYLFHFVCSIKD